MSKRTDTSNSSVSSIEAARELFPGAKKWTYMDVSLRGLISSRVRDAVTDYLDERMNDGGDKQKMLATVEEARQLYARLIHAEPIEIAYTKNVSEGLNMVAGGLNWQEGDNVVVSPELEHPNNVYLWYNLRRRAGVEVRAIAHRNGFIPVGEMIDAIDERTRLLTVPTVSFSPGFVTDIEPLARACREKGVIFLVDAAQSVGVLDTDVRSLGADALTVATQKGLLAFYGMGFLYCRRELAERLWPAYLARFGVDVGGGETALGGEQLRLNPGARRFDLGNYNYLAAVAAKASIELLLGFGTGRIEAHVRRLSSRLACGLVELGLPVCGAPPGPHLGHIVTVGRLGGGHDTTSDPAMNGLHQHLAAKGVKLSVRRGVLRFSLHLYNDARDVDRVLELAKEWKKKAHGCSEPARKV